MSSLLAIDIGNSNITVGLSDAGSDWLATWRLRSSPEPTADELGMQLRELLSFAGYHPTQLVACAIASVRASLGVRCEDAIRRWLGCRVETIRVHPTVPLRLSYADQELGVDRWVNAVAALEYFPDGEAFALIADLGSATTIDAISASGELLGGVILPGPEAFATALFERAPALPRLDPFLCASDEVLAHCTKDALRGGLFVGYLEMLKGLLARFETRLGATCPRLLTGGRAETFAAVAPELGQVVPMLTLDGIRLLLRRRLATF